MDLRPKALPTRRTGRRLFRITQGAKAWTHEIVKKKPGTIVPWFCRHRGGSLDFDNSLFRSCSSPWQDVACDGACDGCSFCGLITGRHPLRQALLDSSGTRALHEILLARDAVCSM